MTVISKEHRKQLEKATLRARVLAEQACEAALENLAVHEGKYRSHMSAAQRTLRNQLRERGRALGDVRDAKSGAQSMRHVAEAAAYEQWHRLLFTRFLTENSLLHTDEENGDVSISLQECDELAADLGARDGFDLACRFASRSLPGVFRSDEPVLALRLAPNDVVELRSILDKLPVAVFTASDALGWTYQFWQAERKDQVNAAGNKIGADELPSVTQLFTEDYMVDFLLDNTLGAWHAGKVLAANPKVAENAQSEDELRHAVALPGCPWRYLRFIKGKDGKWTPAAGTFNGWPKTAKELKCLDPCMGSGHFVVAMFERLVALRLAEEKLDEAVAVAAVIRDNLFGLEIDPRCTQIGAFNLALAAWRRVGHCKLPAMNLACSGLAPNTREADWLAIAGDNQKLQRGMERLYRLFQKAAVLGSLINPRAGEGDLLVAAFHELQPLLEKALAQETKDDTAHEMAVTARGLAKAAEILAGQFTLVATNVPYLNFVKQGEILKAHSESAYPDSKADLATCFVERCVAFAVTGGTASLVTPNNWLSLGSYKALRKKLLSRQSWNFAARLGPGAFETIGGEVVNVVLVGLSNCVASRGRTFCGLNASENPTPPEKAIALREGEQRNFPQSLQLENPDCRIVLESRSELPLLNEYAESYQGLCTGDFPGFGRLFWEMPTKSNVWEFQQSPVDSSTEIGGLQNVVCWEKGNGRLRRYLVERLGEGGLGAWIRGEEAWGQLGVAVRQVGGLPVARYLGNIYDNNMAVIIPTKGEWLTAVFAFCSSKDFCTEVRKLDQKLNVTNQTLLKVPIDLAHWQKVAAEKYPHGLPKPFSSDPTQWLFNGHPAGADQPLHVAVARLLGYQWPRQTGSSFPDCPALGPDGLETLADDDGIVCLPPINREQPAAQRLRALLAQALGQYDERALIAGTSTKPSKSTTLEDWLRDEFFEQHCALFHHRPFVWHIWDGRKDGFHALLNCHMLDNAKLQKLAYSYLGDWMRQQAEDAKADKPGAAERLGAARALQAELASILVGEAPQDIFVRWKPISKQAQGWQPDNNDGVRLNIRPFVYAEDVGRAGAGILRSKPNIKWEKDRGKEPERSRAEYPWFWCAEEPDAAGLKPGKAHVGNRWNDVHLTLAGKQAGKSMTVISKEHRKQLEKATLRARVLAEQACEAALENLAVHEGKYRSHMSAAQRTLRNQLRERGRALGDVRDAKSGAQSMRHVAEAAAYEQWHRLLFTRFLTENSLLHTDEENGDVSISLQECDELAADLGARDGFDLACRFASRSLPGVFRSDEPVLALRLAPNDVVELRSILDKLPVAVFTASDALGWTYQFWQAERKDQVNAAGNKIGADELPSVTQLFTEDYMVDFLLDNTLGAWHAGKVLAANPKLAENAQSEDELRQAVALPGCPWKYLRFIQGKDGKWTPAAGTFEGWPKAAKDLTCLDPCMGSGHFVVAMFERLVALRLAEEKLDEAAAVAAVIRDNLFGLEIDPRCTQIAAFNLALAAWRRVGHCTLPAMNLACSGLAPNATDADWMALAGDNEKLQNGMERLYRLFQKAAVLGSLINPRAGEGDLLVAAFHELQPLLEKALAQETKDDTAHEMAVTARGLAKAAEILAGQFTLVATNVPYLGRSKQDEVLMDYCERVHPDAQADLATCFIERCSDFCALGGSTALVTPHGWLYLDRYEPLRTTALTTRSWCFASRLGTHAFETISGEVVNVSLVSFTNAKPVAQTCLLGLDVSAAKSPSEKAIGLISGAAVIHNQFRQLSNPDARLVVGRDNASEGNADLLSKFADCYQGLRTGDANRFIRCFWESVKFGSDWDFFQTTSDDGEGDLSGLSFAILWQRGRGELASYAAETRDKLHDMHESGNRSWGKRGVAVGQMTIRQTWYFGDKFDNSLAVITPFNAQHLPALWAYCSSSQYRENVREIAHGLYITNQSLLKVPFDLAHWQKVAAEKYPHGLLKPFSSDPTQWLFNGHPAGANQPLHVAVARLLGYQWPRQTGSSFPDCPALGPDGLETLADDDGIVCLAPINREQPAAQRLRALLAQALGQYDERALIAGTSTKPSKSTTLEDWLRDEFFEQHCALFHHRPFVWHIWDGRKDGFHALLNCHMLDNAKLQKLAYSYLGDWIRQQAEDAKADKPGASGAAGGARALQAELASILVGEAPQDIFVRWKPISKQAQGWQPDNNDGVRMNIRPFMYAEDVGRAGAGILRSKPNIKWEKDRGKEPERSRAEYPWFWCAEEPDAAGLKPGKAHVGNRWNDVHLTLAGKQAGKSMTVLARLLAALRKAADYNRHELAPPRVILWPDEERLWVDCIQTLRANYPALWVLGGYEPEQGSGPGAWLRLQLDTHSSADVPVIYLPGIGGAAFRRSEDFPKEATHLFALQYQGQFLRQKNGRDLTPLAFLSNIEGGLGLDVAGDQDTKAAIQESLPALLQVSVAGLGGRKLEASDFRAFITTDPVRTLLQWMSDPAGCKRELLKFGSAWASFCAVCRADYGVDPDGDGALSAAERLTQGSGGWPVVWGRYKESPRAYPGIKLQLENCKPLDMFQNREYYPQVNREEEEKLAVDLLQLASAAPKDASEQIVILHTQHANRAKWVWAALGDSPLALAVGYLREMAEQVRATGTPATWAQLAEFYLSSGWQADRSVLQALDVARTPAASQAVGVAVRASYLAWLDKLALVAQGLAATYPNTGPATCRQFPVDDSTVYLFVDGLRMDLAKSLEAQLIADGLEVALEHAWSALPSVTATAKPAWLPLAEKLCGPLEGGSFQPKEDATGKALVHARFKQLLPELGIAYLPYNALELPTQCAWTESGAFDTHGHDEGARLAWRVNDELASLQVRIAGLLQAGWKTVKVVTDHGWLLLPGGLPKAELPKHLTESRWGRCAAPEPGAQHGYAVTNWFWDAMEPVVLAPGIACFKAGMEYAHGGLTVQECLIPTLVVRSNGSSAGNTVRILEKKWAGQRLNISFEGAAGLTVDLRIKAADGTTTVATSTAIAKADGQRTSILAAAEDAAGKAAFLVVIDQNGQPVFKQAIVIGEN